MSVANKKRLSRIKGINWKKVILWTFNIVCYVITFIFTISLIVGSIKKPSTQQQSSNSAIDLTQQQKYGLSINEGQSITIEGNELKPRYYASFIGDDSEYSLPINLNIGFTYNDTFFEAGLHFVDVDYDSVVECLIIYYTGSFNIDYTVNYFISFYPLSIDSDIDTFSFILDGYFSFDISCFVYFSTDEEIVYVDYVEIYSAPTNLGNTLYWSVYGYYYGDTNTDLFDTISSTIPSFVSTINSGLNEAITIFYDDGLTTIGYLSAIVVAVVLGYFSLRAVMGLIRLRG